MLSPLLPDLDPLLHNQLRLSIMSILMQVRSMDFTQLLKETQASKGNLSTQIKKLEEAGYIKVKKTYRKNYPLTTVSISPKGRRAFEQYFENIKKYYEK